MEKQIEIVRVQRDADLQVKAAEANAKAELYRALAVVAQTNPDQASAVTVALAVQGLGGEGEVDAGGVVPLQPLQNEGLEYAKVFAGPAMNLVSGLGVAYINADVAKTQSDNAAAVQINDSLQDSAIVNAVAGLGTAAANATGLMVNGNYYSVTDEGVIDQSSVVTTTQTTTAITDSYNTTDNSNNSDNSDNSVVDNSATDYSTSTTNNDYRTTNEYITYEGTQFTLAGLLEYLQGTGEPYSIAIGDDVYSSEEEGGGGITCIPSFSPGGWDCTEG